MSFKYSIRKKLSVMQAATKAGGINVAATVDPCTYSTFRVLQLIYVRRRNGWSQVPLMLSCLFTNSGD